MDLPTATLNEKNDTRCLIHEEPLHRGTAVVVWGLPAIGRAEYEATERLFPDGSIQNFRWLHDAG